MVRPELAVLESVKPKLAVVTPARALTMPEVTRSAPITRKASAELPVALLPAPAPWVSTKLKKVSVPSE